MKLAAKQLLALGVSPSHIRELDELAEGEELQLRQLVQRIIAQWLQERRAAA